MPEKIMRLADKNRLVIPKNAFDALELKQGNYVLVKWDSDKKQIEISPCVIKPVVPA
jgi:bifunctional DNA-binding transcriptional regulator/antitoxin component of YhaV-PrlF toxin-antitoxin module